MKRPTVWRIAFAAVLGAAWFAQRSASAPENLKAVSVQMHLHGSMSEGTGSMRGANVQAKKLNLDVLWWTDHDWRIAYHTYADGYDFEADDLSDRPLRAVPAGPRTHRTLDPPGSGCSTRARGARDEQAEGKDID